MIELHLHFRIILGIKIISEDLKLLKWDSKLKHFEDFLASNAGFKTLKFSD